MKCGAAIPADAESCAQCGTAFAQQSGPGDDDNPRTVAMHEVPPELDGIPDPAPKSEPPVAAPPMGKHGTVPISPEDLDLERFRPAHAKPKPAPREPDVPDSMAPGTVMMAHEPEPESESGQATQPKHDASAVAEGDDGPDSGTMVMSDILAQQQRDAEAKAQRERRRADPYAKTAAATGAEMPEAVAAIIRHRKEAAEQKQHAESAPQHYSVPPPPAHDPMGDMTPPPVSVGMPAPPKGDDLRGGGAPLMSMVAGTAKIVSEAFNSGFGNALPGWRTEVTPPQGPSTEGGKQALMPITLVNDQGQRIAIGHADAGERTVIMKTHRGLLRHYAQRYNRGWDVSPEQYAALLETISAFFTAMQFEFRTDSSLENTVMEPTGMSDERRPIIILGVVFCACVLAIIIALVLR